jgi:hypothetical protein
MALRLFDPARGAVDDVRPAVTRVLRIGAGDGVRVAIVADLLRRLAERERWQTAVFGTSSLTDRQLLYLNVHPFHEPGPEVQLSVRDAAAPAGPGRNVVVAALEAYPPVPDYLDPLAPRLALLHVHYREPAAVDGATIRELGADLERWRGLVAAWAEHPSAPMAGHEPIIERLQDDLDTPGALAALDRLAADDSVPPGARFEAFAHLDRLLGLDLASEVGRH